jgi:hypothetical protein
MPTRIVFAAPGVKGGVLTQVFVEEPQQVLEAFAAADGAPFTLTARTSREEAVHVNPAGIVYWTAYSPSRARAGNADAGDRADNADGAT